MGKLDRSWIYRDFKETMTARFGSSRTEELWEKANQALARLEKQHAKKMTREAKKMILPAAALYEVLHTLVPNEVMPMLKNYGTEIGEQLAEKIHNFTSIPGVSKLIWNRAPFLMRRMSSPGKGYKREILSEDEELVAVNILSCPIHNGAVAIGMPELCHVICAMDKEYMTGFRYIHYTRTTSVAEGDACCDYRLTYAPKMKRSRKKNKKDHTEENH